MGPYAFLYVFRGLMISNGCLCVLMRAYKFLWVLMCSYRFLGYFMGRYGSFLVLMCPYVPL